MSLYEGVVDIGVDEGKDDSKEAVGWTTGLKFLQSQMKFKKATLTQVKRERDRSVIPQLSVSIAPVIDLNARNKNKFSTTIVEEKTTSIIVDDTPPPLSFLTGDDRTKPVFAGGGNVLFGEIELLDEYNPLVPNDYEKFASERSRKGGREKDRLADVEIRRRERDYEERERRHRRDFDDDVEDDRTGGSLRNSFSGGAMIAPPQTLIDQDAKVLDAPKSPPAMPELKVKGMAAATKIMEKYGYKLGQGLGKQEQGMSQALQIERVTKRTGKIIHEKDIPKDPLIVQQESITEILKNPTKVVLMKNMVGPGEVDEFLEGEIKEECLKYGDVQKCVIFELPDSIEEEAIRIFVEFAKLEQAIKAVVDLNGRYFGGRIIKALFYNIDKFRRMDLAE